MGNLVRIEDWRELREKQEESKPEKQGVKKVSVDDGFTAIPNELLKAILRSKVLGWKGSYLLATILKTLSWRKESDWFTHSQVCEMMEIAPTKYHINQLSAARKELLKERILFEDGKKTGVNLSVFSWEMLNPEKVGSSRNNRELVPEKVGSSRNNRELVPEKIGNDYPEKVGNTKETITKEKIKDNPLPPKAKKFVAENFELPKWVNLEDWIGFCEMRKSIKKPLSEKACKIALGKLEDLKSQGENVSEVLKQSTFNNWQGLFRVHDSNGEKSSLTDNIDFQAVIDAFNDEFEGRYAEVELNDTTRKIILNLAPLLKNQTVEGFAAYFETYNEIAGEYYDRFGFSFVMKPETLQKVREGAL